MSVLLRGDPANRGPAQAAPSLILHEVARQHCWEGTGALSIKSLIPNLAPNSSSRF